MLCKKYQRVSTQYILTNLSGFESPRTWTDNAFIISFQDVILQTSTLGNFLDYGTVVPLTASELVRVKALPLLHYSQH